MNADAPGGGVRCVACHTADGFRRVLVRGETLTASDAGAIAARSLRREHGVSCDACHGSRAGGLFHGSDANPLRLAKEELCSACHNAATVTFADFRDRGTSVFHPQREMLAGTAGDAPPGVPASAITAHSLLPGGCVTCHSDSANGLASHDFRPDVATCTSCHAGLATFDRPARGDYDGDGALEGIQHEVSGLLEAVKTALLADPMVAFASGRFDYAGAADHAMTGASLAQKRAVFNWTSVAEDGSRGVHDAARAVQLLQGSYRELTGADVPGAAIR
jgi:hypothetical protein